MTLHAKFFLLHETEPGNYVFKLDDYNSITFNSTHPSYEDFL